MSPSHRNLQYCVCPNILLYMKPILLNDSMQIIAFTFVQAKTETATQPIQNTVSTKSCFVINLKKWVPIFKWQLNKTSNSPKNIAMFGCVMLVHVIQNLKAIQASINSLIRPSTFLWKACVPCESYDKIAPGTLATQDDSPISDVFLSRFIPIKTMFQISWKLFSSGQSLHGYDPLIHLIFPVTISRATSYLSPDFPLHLNKAKADPFCWILQSVQPTCLKAP